MRLAVMIGMLALLMVMRFELSIRSRPDTGSNAPRTALSVDLRMGGALAWQP